MATDTIDFSDAKGIGERKPNIFQRFERDLIDRENDHTRNKTLFCRPCALLDFKDEVASMQHEFKRQGGHELTREQMSEIKAFKQLVDKFAFEKYEGAHKFTHLTSTPVYELRQIGTTRENVLMGYNVSYICAKYKTHKLTLSLTLEEYEQWKRTLGAGSNAGKPTE